MSFNQPGPYGQQGPYVRPPQPPHGPQGPNPYVQAPQAPQVPMPPMPPLPPQAPPPQGTGKGRAIGIVATAVVLVAAIAGGGWMLLGKGDSRKPAKAVASDTKPAAPSPAPSSAAPAGKRYKLVAPDKVAETYAKDPSGSGDGFDSGDLEDLRTLGVVNPQNLSAAYKTGDERTQKLVRFTGAWGDEVKSPEAVVDGLFRLMALSAGKDKDPDTKTSVEGTPQKVTPAGLDDGAVMKCQNMVMSGPAFAGHTIKVPMCIWGDHSTVGTVMHMDTSAIRTGVTPTADEAGAFATKVRHDMRVEIPN